MELGNETPEEYLKPFTQNWLRFPHLLIYLQLKRYYNWHFDPISFNSRYGKNTNKKDEMISKNQGPSETHLENYEKDINLKIDLYMNISYKIYENISVGIMAKVLSLMATHIGDGSLYNRSVAEIDDQLSNIEENKEYAGTPYKRCGHAGMSYIKCVHTRGLPVHEVRTPSSLTSRQKSALTWGFLCLARGI